MGFTVEDKYLIKYSVNKQKVWCKLLSWGEIWHMKEFQRIKHLTEKMTSSSSSKDQQKLKISHWFYWSLSLAYQVFIFSQTSILSNCFVTLFTHSRPFNEMFIISGKSCCCNSTFTYVVFTSLLTNCSMKRQTKQFSNTKFRILWTILHNIFIQIAWYF